uniref:Uncharacterized protein n=1 Tax=Ditylum brightwellii TaxID=49249 RepID=A0A7S2E6P8_9STRA|mmetsp:Transcript_16389/g.24329  ORF Transcript_16389/g.24329 Transcript_16389/m.24329 type:complete len:179 (+) Transcript_16389:600-1136(+)
MPSPPALRLALFNFAEAWVFAFLPLMQNDKRKLPTPVVVLTWVGALGLTNAFLAPYLAFREIFSPVPSSPTDIVDDDGTNNKNQLISTPFAIIASTVVGYALLQTIIATFTSGSQEWIDFSSLVQTDRTYLAFCVDLVLFGSFQSFLINKIVNENESDDTMIYNVPFVGLMVWLLRTT